MNSAIYGESVFVTKPHFHLNKVNVLLSDTRSFLEACPVSDTEITMERAIQERWFGNKSDARIKNIIQVFKIRYVQYVRAFLVLKDIQKYLGNTDWKWVILIHLIASDPIFRYFAGEYYVSLSYGEIINRERVSRDMEPGFSANIRSTTRLKFAEGLVLAGKSLGLFTVSSPYTKVPLEFSAFGLYYILSFCESLGIQDDFLGSPYFGTFFQDREDYRAKLWTLVDMGFGSVTWYGDSPKISLKSHTEVFYGRS